MKFRLYFLFLIFISAIVVADEDLGNQLMLEFHESLSKLSSDFEITDVKKTPIDGIYQVMIGSDVIYMTRDGNYVLKGEILDIRDRRNLTEDALAGNRINLLNTITKDEYIEFASN